jgi:hypothetical protein
METPVDRTIGRAGRLTAAAEADIEGTTKREGRWTAAEDRMLIRAADMFAVTRWSRSRY